MRYSTLYVESVRRWAVVDCLSGATRPEFFATESEARAIASIEEFRWTQLVAGALPAPA